MPEAQAGLPEKAVAASPNQLLQEISAVTMRLLGHVQGQNPPSQVTQHDFSQFCPVPADKQADEDAQLPYGLQPVLQQTIFASAGDHGSDESSVPEEEEPEQALQGSLGQPDQAKLIVADSEEESERSPGHSEQADQAMEAKRCDEADGSRQGSIHLAHEALGPCLVSTNAEQHSPVPDQAMVEAPELPASLAASEPSLSPAGDPLLMTVAEACAKSVDAELYGDYNETSHDAWHQPMAAGAASPSYCACCTQHFTMLSLFIQLSLLVLHAKMCALSVPFMHVISDPVIQSNLQPFHLLSSIIFRHIMFPWSISVTSPVLFGCSHLV